MAAKAILRYKHNFLYIETAFKDISVPDLPGGGLVFNESPLDGLVREVKEELNLEMSNIKYVDLVPFYQLNGTLNLCYLFCADISSFDNLLLEDTIVTFKFVSLEYIINKVLFLRQIENKIKEICLRA